MNQKRGDNLVWPGMSALAEILGYSSRQKLTRYVKELRQVGAIDWVDERDGSRVYLVHKTPPEGHHGFVSLTDFHKDRRERMKAEQAARLAQARDGAQRLKDPEARRRTPLHAEECKNSGGGTLTGSGGGTQQGSRGGTRKGARTNLTELSDANDLNDSVEGNSIEGALAEVDPSGSTAKSKPKQRGQVKASSLVGKSQAHVVQRLTAIWSAAVTEAGGELPLQEFGGFDGFGEPNRRGDRHPVGGQIKDIIEQYPLSVTQLEELLGSIRRHAIAWAASHPAVSTASAA
ncbi:hypothetical protein [Amycolatopsis sp. NBC_01480]|uniref:hypothetical protein n=1 Tax=Amycolatopsis sp. NBC_01480 TaxID=2903562 RepID=UPI002E2E2E8D|nr:hypothetical protein [Amycolatopsis sp. NBC_01480]